MKKTLLRLKLKLLITPQSSLSKTLLFMKMTVLLILLTTLQAVAGDAKAQLVTIQNQSLSNNRFSGVFEKENVEEAFKALQLITMFKYDIHDNEVLIK